MGVFEPISGEVGCRIARLSKHKEGKGMKKNRIRQLHEMSHDEVKEAATNAVAIVPIGATEQHGYLPIGLDFFTCLYMAQCVAMELREMTRGLQIIMAPGLPFGASEHHIAYPGTVSLGGTMFAMVLGQILRELHRAGFRIVAVINGHGGNENSIAAAVKDATSYCPGLAVHAATLHYLMGPGDWKKMHPDLPLPESNTLSGELSTLIKEGELSHADAAEASMLGVYRPELLRETHKRMRKLKVGHIPDMTQVSGIRHPQQWFDTMAPGNGGKGDPRRATAAAVFMAKKMMEAAACQTACDIAELRAKM